MQVSATGSGRGRMQRKRGRENSAVDLESAVDSPEKRPCQAPVSLEGWALEMHPTTRRWGDVQTGLFTEQERDAVEGMSAAARKRQGSTRIWVPQSSNLLQTKLRDMRSMEPGALATDNAVACYGRMLQRDLRSSDNDFCVVDTFIRHYVINEALDRKLRNYTAHITARSKVLIPWHMPGYGGRGGHWALVVADMASKTIQYVDSLNRAAVGTALNDCETRFAQKLVRRMEEFMSGSMERSTTAWPVTVGRSSHQGSSVDCGVFVMNAMREVAEGGLQGADLHGATLRMHMVLELTNNRLCKEGETVRGRVGPFVDPSEESACGPRRSSRRRQRHLR